MIRKTLPVLIGTLLSSTLAFADVSLEIKGLNGALEDNVDAYLSAIPEEEYSVSLRFQSRLESMIKEALNALGYYHPNITFSHPEDDTEMTVTVEPGEPVVIYTSDIVLTGEAKDDPDFLALIARSKLSKGSILNHGNYDSLKSSIRNLGLAKGYFDGAYDLSKLEVAPELNRAYVRLHYNSGIRYHFGTTTVTGSQIEDDKVQSLKPFEDGEPYSITKVGEYNQNLSNTDWFSSVFVEPDLSQLGEGREIPMKVSLAPQARNQIETGIGVSTDLGVKGTLKWKKPWVNEKGHSFNSSLSISKPEQTITAAYKIPLDDVLNDYYQIKYGMKNLDNRDTKSLESNLALERYWRLDNGWQRTVFIRYLVENYEQGLQDRNAAIETDDRIGVTVSTQISDKVLFNGKVGVPVGASSETLVAGDFEIQVLLNEEGTLSAKFFSRQSEIQTFLPDQQGSTQGAGLSYEVDFNSFKELFRKILRKKEDKKEIKKEDLPKDSLQIPTVMGKDSLLNFYAKPKSIQ